MVPISSETMLSIVPLYTAFSDQTSTFKSISTLLFAPSSHYKTGYNHLKGGMYIDKFFVKNVAQKLSYPIPNSPCSHQKPNEHSLNYSHSNGAVVI
jgi:hypothetical protein